jgi:hypothetical protein
MPAVSPRVRSRTLALAVLLATIAMLAASAPRAALAAGPAAVTVRVEGLNSTLAPLTPVTTTATPASGDGGAHACPSGYNAANALTLATGGHWSGTYYTSFGDYLVSTIAGETYPPPSGPNAAYTGFYWSFWYDHAPASAGICSTPVVNGDEILFFPDCAAYGSSTCPPGWVSPNVLGLAAPSVAQRGQPVQVTVTSYANANGSPSPTGGATVSTPGGNATTDASGHASVTLNTTGNFGLQATAPNSLRSETRGVCVHDGNDGNCGFPATPQGSSGGGAGSTVKPTPITALSAAVAGIVEGQHFKKGPRQLAGSVIADAAGVSSVQLRLERRMGRGRMGRSCTGYDGTTERFVHIRCGIANAPWFGLAAQSTFNYLLPRALPKGRYVIELVATDKAGHSDRIDLGRNELIFYVG